MTLHDEKGGGAARTTDPRTSHDAARRVRRSKFHALIIGELKKPGAARPGRTCKEIQRLTGCYDQSLTPRMHELRDLQLIRWKIDPATGKVMRRDGSNVYELVPQPGEKKS